MRAAIQTGRVPPDRALDACAQAVVWYLKRKEPIEADYRCASLREPRVLVAGDPLPVRLSRSRRMDVQADQHGTRPAAPSRRLSSGLLVDGM